MKKEIDAALDLFVAYVQRFGTLKQVAQDQFRIYLQQTLFERYQGHWYPDKPIKGQAFRSLEFNKDNDYCDVIVAQICQQLGFASSLLGIRHELTLWIDPFDVTIRLGNHASPKENQPLVIARFDQNGNQLIHNDLEYILSRSRATAVMVTLGGSATQSSHLSPTVSSPCDSASCSGSSTPQRTTSPYPNGQLSANNSTLTQSTVSLHNVSTSTTQRGLSPQAPSFQMSSSSPIKVPNRFESVTSSLHVNSDLTSYDGSPIDGNHLQPDRSDTPHSMHSTTSNESTDSGYCGYVESFPYYYKLNRLYKALAIQKLSMGAASVGKNPTHSPIVHHRRTNFAAQQYQQYPQQQFYQYGHHQINNIPNTVSSLSNSPPTPTPMNINQLSPFFNQASSYISMPTAINEGRNAKC